MADNVFDIIRQQTSNTGDWSAADTSKTLATLAAKQQELDISRQQNFQDSVAAAAQGFDPVSGSGSGNSVSYTNAQLGNPDNPNWATNHLKRISTPEGSVTVNKIAAKAFGGFLSALAARGYNAKSVQGYNNRNIAGTNQKSNHAYGMAIDIDPGSNPQVFGKTAKHSLPPWVGGLANKYGILWGGDWNRQKDYMHFEYNASSVAKALARAKAEKANPPKKNKPPAAKINQLPT